MRGSTGTPSASTSSQTFATLAIALRMATQVPSSAPLLDKFHLWMFSFNFHHFYVMFQMKYIAQVVDREIDLKKLKYD